MLNIKKEKIMSFDKEYPNRKDHRKKYYGSKKCDKSCRNNGGCEYCENNRMHNTKKRKEYTQIDIFDYR